MTTERSHLSSALARLAGHKLAPTTLIAAAQITLVLVVLLDYVTGPELSPVLFYLIPVIFVVWTAGLRWGIAMAVAVTLAELVVFELEALGTSQWVIITNTAERFVFYLLIAWLVSAQRELFMEQRDLANTDTLTGIMNRRAFFDEAERILVRDRRGRRPTACLYLDLDGLKQVNDRDGHRAGDRLIERFSAAVAAELRAGDLFARLGGDEFGVLLPETDPAEASDVAERLLAALATEAGTPPLAASIGVIVLPPDDRRDIDGMVRAADEAMYTAKRAGGRQVHVARLVA